MGEPPAADLRRLSFRAADRAALAAILDGQKKFDQSLPIYLSVLRTFRRLLGPVHYEIAVTPNNLAAVRAAQGNRTAALQLYRRSLAMKAKLLGRDHPDVGITLNTLMLEMSSGRHAEAVERLTRAATIFTRKLGTAHPSTVLCRRNLVNARSHFGIPGAGSPPSISPTSRFRNERASRRRRRTATRSPGSNDTSRHSGGASLR